MYKRQQLYNTVSERINFLFFSIEKNGSLNLLDQNIHLETFMKLFLNILYDLNLENLNVSTYNYPAIDLLDRDKKILIQVSTNINKEKVETTIRKLPIEYKNNDYKLVFVGAKKISLSTKNNTYIDEKVIKISLQESFVDVNYILSYILDMDIEKLEKLEKFVNKEILIPNEITMETDLAEIVNILSIENKALNSERRIPKTFDIDKKIRFNNLDRYNKLINNNAKYYIMINNIYESYEKNDVDIVSGINDYLLELYISKGAEFDGEKLLEVLLQEVKDFVRSSKNFNNSIRVENFNKCILIIIVESFIKCNIFEDPEGYVKEEV